MNPIPLALPADLFAPAATRHYEGDAQCEVLSRGVDIYTFDTPLHWEVDVTNTGDAFLVNGIVAGEATTSCARCLEPVDVALTGEIEGFFLIDEQDEARDDLDADAYQILPANHVIDLEPLITAALLLEMPLVPLCAPDCKGLCPHCGQNLNEGSCDCAPSSGEKDDSADNPFSVLKDFPFDT